MMATKCLFIGGHMDGRMEIVPDELNMQERVVPKNAGLNSNPPLTYPATERYYKHRISAATSIHQLMILTSIPQDKVLGLLIDRYHRFQPAGQS